MEYQCVFINCEPEASPLLIALQKVSTEEC